MGAHGLVCLTSAQGPSLSRLALQVIRPPGQWTEPTNVLMLPVGGLSTVVP